MKCLCGDVHCVVPRSVTNIAEEGKQLKYTALAARFRFAPVTLEVMGIFVKRTAAHLLEIGHRFSEVTGDRRKITG